jgi:predicted RNase H-like nuclease
LKTPEAFRVSGSDVTFIGVDLAWSPRNRTGAAVARGNERGGTLLDTALLGDDAENINYVAAWAGAGPAIVAVDAPLRVPNEQGRRPAEAEIGRAFGRYQAGAHPANRSRLVFGGAVRGEALVAALEARGFAHRPEVAAGARVRQVVEVFPHPAMVAIFGLGRTLKYKARAKRPKAQRMAEWRRYQAYLDGLNAADPPLMGQNRLTAQDVAGLRGRRLKDYEDRVDALMCAYIALYALRWGAARCRVFGTFEAGSIFTPVPEELWKPGE